MYDIQGLQCFIKIYGKGKPVILLHGWGQTYSFWESIVPLLSREYQVFVLDLPGFGYSQEPGTIWLIKDYATFLHSFVQYFKLFSPIIIGHSFGGRIAAYYTSEFPVAKLILYSASGLGGVSMSTHFYMIVVKLLKYIFPNQLYSFQSWIFKPEQYKNKNIVSTKRSKLMLEIYLNHYEKLEETYKKIKTPTLLIYGERDYIVKPEVGKRIQGLIGNSQITLIPNATHFSHIENPGIFIESMNYFLQ